MVVIRNSNGVEVKVEDIVAGANYTATFTVAATNNYTGLEEVVTFTVGFSVVNMPEIRIDTTTGEIVAANGTGTITYDGVSHMFVGYSEDGEAYTFTISHNGYSNWKNADTYTLTIKLTGNYSWADTNGDRSDLVYTLVIEKAALTITADGMEITYGDATPTAFTATATGFVNSETFATYNVSIEDYLTLLNAVANSEGLLDAGNYDISFIADTETSLEALLINYDVTLNNGTLTVNKKNLGDDDDPIGGEVDPDDPKTWEDILTEGFTLEYDAETHALVLTLPDELTYSVTYTLNGEASGVSQNAGNYIASVTFAFKEGLNSENYIVPGGANNITITITKVKITVTAMNQTVAYTGSEVEIVTSADKATWAYGGTKTSGLEFLSNEIVITGVQLTGSYSIEGAYADAIEALLDTSKYLTSNYDITFVNGTLTIEKQADGTITITLNVTNRAYNGAALKEGSEGSYVDFYAVLTSTDANVTFDRAYVTYFFYSAASEDAILNEAPRNAGTYYIVAIYDNGINTPIQTDFVAITISKATITITLEDIVTRYLVDYTVAAGANMPTLEVDDGYTPAFSYEYFKGSETLGAKPTDAGSYTVTVSINNLTENYEAAAITANLTINKAKLASVTFTYNADTATWEAITTTTDGESITKYDVARNVVTTVTYTINGDSISVDSEGKYSFTATSAGIFSVVASVEGNDNFESSTTEMAEVFSITFADKVENHP